MSNKLKYGVTPGMGEPIYGAQLFAFYASQVLSAKSGRYCAFDQSAGYWYACIDNQSTIGGYCDQAMTTSSTSGATKLPLARNVGEFATELPFASAGTASTLTSAILNGDGGATGVIDKIIDLYVASNIQYADNATSQHILRVIGGDVENNTLYVCVMNADIGPQS